MKGKISETKDYNLPFKFDFEIWDHFLPIIKFRLKPKISLSFYISTHPQNLKVNSLMFKKGSIIIKHSNLNILIDQKKF